MSLDKIAKILHVDEVRLMHGPKGVAVHVRIEKSWHIATIDNDVLGDRRLEVIAEHLGHLADAHIHKARDLRKSQVDAATRAAVQAQEIAEARRAWSSWQDLPPVKSDVETVLQVQRFEPMRSPVTPLVDPPSFEPAVTAPMPSRFHAIVDELRNL